jgi:mannosylglucosylglycerate synthase
VARIAFIHNQLRGTDGVSLEVDKWRQVLEGMGHEVFYVAGNEGKGIITIPELSFEHPAVHTLLQEGTSIWTGTFRDGAALMDEGRRVASSLKDQLLKAIDQHRIDFLIPHNLLSIGYNIPAVISLTEVIADRQIAASGHWHDFWWEGEQSGEVNPTCPEVRQLLQEKAPPLLPNLIHTVINSFGRSAMKERKKYDAAIIPNVFDYTQQWKIDDYNRDFRNSFGIGKNDIVFLQATRVMDRKAIELAIDVVAEVGKPELRTLLERSRLYDGRQFSSDDRIILLCAGYVETFGISGSYRQQLERHAKDVGVTIIFAGDRVKHSRGTCPAGKLYSLFTDAYPNADFVTYCSVWEGFGNQFLEAICGRQPVVLFEYPVYKADLKQLGFDVVSIGDTYSGTLAKGLLSVDAGKIREAGRQVVTLLTDKTRREEAVTRNLEIATEHFSYEALKRHLAALCKRALG